MNQTVAVALSLAIGVILPIQIFANARLGAATGQPMLGAIINNFVGLLVMLAVALVIGVRWPGAQAFAGLPVWAWLGGIIGATYVGFSLLLGPQLGGAAFFALTIAGQMLASLAIDHYGLFDAPTIAMTPSRVIGAVLLVIGVVLLLRK